MNTFIKKIGLLDKWDNEHSVTLRTGVNVITGRSATGKSALIEIFDFCFGSSENNIPQGVITKYSVLFFVVFELDNCFLILARKSQDLRSAYIQQLSDLKKSFSLEDFNENLFIPLTDFKKQLGTYFGLNVTDIEENSDDALFRGKKKESPSIRNIVPYLIQNQNLITSKTLLFYRFNDQEKKRQTIEQFRIFAGFVEQRYFLCKQNINELNKKLRRLEAQRKWEENNKIRSDRRLHDLFSQFSSIVGYNLNPYNLEEVLKDPLTLIKKLDKQRENINEESQEFLRQLEELDSELSVEEGKNRELDRKLLNIRQTQKIQNEIKNGFNSIEIPSQAKIYKSQCPFCSSFVDSLSTEANELTNAINWLNKELAIFPIFDETFKIEEKRIFDEKEIILSRLTETRKKRDNLLRINQNLLNKNSLYKQASIILYKIEAEIELNTEARTDFDAEIFYIKNEIQKLTNLINGLYNVDKKMKESQDFINSSMNDLANRLDFEESYKPLKLDFNLSTFDLFNINEDGSRTSLSQMGSGANWLYSHLCLFMAFTRFFSHHIDTSLVPPILFLDQPSQVYFPITPKEDSNQKDDKTGDLFDFDDQNLREDDIRCVENFFDQIIDFNNKTKQQNSGIEPQIIITDHADNLKLKNGTFDDIVVARWRNQTSGLIDKTLFPISTDDNF